MNNISIMLPGLSLRCRSSCLAALKKRKINSVHLSERRSLHTPNPVLQVSEEIREAVHAKKPVVALETTIYTHGFPYPENLELATHLEATVRANGGIPATCAVLDGVCRVGLQAEEMDRLVRDRGARKISRRDFGFIAGQGLSGTKTLNGGTTISGTMILAHLAGIRVFATGGLGGVHRGGESSLDISADLTELGRTPVAVISSGCKGFLDIPRTLEYLETEGAGVATFADGRTGSVDFPAFWSRDSGVPSPMVVQNEAEAAAIIYAQQSLKLNSGLLFANPIPPQYEIPVAELAIIIKEALRLAEEQGASGSANTPHVLSSIRELSGGRSVPANRALIESNIIRGTRVAVELSNLERGSPQSPRSGSDNDWFPKSAAHAAIPARTEVVSKPQSNSNVDLLVAGSIAFDSSCDYIPRDTQPGDITPKLHTSNPCIISQSIGGVGHNIAKAAQVFGGSVRLCSAIADDHAGRIVLNTMQDSGMDVSAIDRQSSTLGNKTAQYISFNDATKNLVIAMADMRILEDSATNFPNETIESLIEAAKPSWLVVDANWDATTLTRWARLAKRASISVGFEPVSTAKAPKLFAGPQSSVAAYPYNKIDLATPNVFELDALYTAAQEASLFEREDWWKVIDSIGISSAGARTELAQATSKSLVDAGIPQKTIQLLPFIPVILTKLGSKGVLLTQLLDAGDQRLHSAAAAPFVLARSKQDNGVVGGIYMRLFPAAEEVKGDDIVSVNGAGDTFLGVLMAMMSRTKGQNVENMVDIAQAASVLTLKSHEAVSPQISRLRRMQEVILE